MKTPLLPKIWQSCLKNKQAGTENSKMEQGRASAIGKHSNFNVRKPRHDNWYIKMSLWLDLYGSHTGELLCFEKYIVCAECYSLTEHLTCSEKKRKKKLFCCRVQCCIIGWASQAKHKAGIPFCSTYARIEQQGAWIAFTRIAFSLFCKISLTFCRQDIYRRRETWSIYSKSHFCPLGKSVLDKNSILRQRYVYLHDMIFSKFLLQVTFYF